MTLTLTLDDIVKVSTALKVSSCVYHIFHKSVYYSQLRGYGTGTVLKID